MYAHGSISGTTTNALLMPSNHTSGGTFYYNSRSLSGRRIAE